MIAYPGIINIGPGESVEVTITEQEYDGYSIVSAHAGGRCICDDYAGDDHVEALALLMEGLAYDHSPLGDGFWRGRLRELFGEVAS